MDNVRTLSGVGIGTAGDGKAYYLILSEKQEGGYEVETRYIDYDKENLGQSINISTLDEKAKDKINSWSGISKRR